MNLRKLGALLLQHSKAVSQYYEAPWLDQKPLSMKNANKYLLFAILDYQILANKAGDNARRLSEEILGDPPKLWHRIITSYSREEWNDRFKDFKLHRFPVAHDRIWRIGSDIVKHHKGDARRIWDGKKPSKVWDALNKLRCGPAISNMIVGGLISCKHVKGKGDIKPDIMTKRVLGSIFDRNLNNSDAITLARNIHPSNPWELDLALFNIGQEYCQKNWTYCDDCPVQSECLTAKQT